MLQANTSNTYRKANLNGQTSGQTNIAILGVPRIAERMYRNSEFPHNIVGFIKIRPSDGIPFNTEFPAILGDVNNLGEIVQKFSIERVWLALDPMDRPVFSEAVRQCKLQKVEFDLPTKSGHISNGTHNDDALYNDSKLYENFLNDVIGEDTLKQPIWLRLFDFFVSTMLFLLFLPSWIVVALAIKLESKGGVLYSQERVGQGGRVFRIYKFRSMFSDAEKRSGPQLATQNDPRITKIGRILRKTRIDELPQLFNVIKGDMSLIGPRPERPYFVEKYRQQIPRYVERLRVKPGLTGWAQVETGYDESLEDVKEKLKHDLYFIDHYRQFKLYVSIVVKTVWVVLSAQGQ